MSFSFNARSIAAVFSDLLVIITQRHDHCWNHDGMWADTLHNAFYSLFIGLLLLSYSVSAAPEWTEQEKSWISEHPVIPYNFAESWPLDYREEGKHVGLSRAYLDLLEKNTGLRFVLAAEGAAEAMLNVSLLPAFIPDGERWRYTQRWLTSNTVVIATYDTSDIRSLEHLRGKRVAVRADTWYEGWLQEHYPDIFLVPLPDVRAVFRAVTVGDADVGLGSDLVMRPLLYRSYSHKLVVAAQIPEMVAGLHVSLPQDMPELQRILDKALGRMSASETDKLFTRWVGELKLGNPSAGVIFSIYTLEISLFLVLLLLLSWALRRALVLRRRAVASEARKTQFLAMMSHEIRTPMNALIAALELLRLPSSAPQRQEYIDLAYSSSKNLLGLLNDILDHSKLSQQFLKLENSCFSVAELAVTLVAIHRPVATAKGLTLLVRIDDALQSQWIEADAHRLRQVMNNLLSNAIKFTEQGKVSLCLEWCHSASVGEKLRIIVADTGIGIPEHAHQTLFDAWVQVDNAAIRRYDGSGLGLYICRGLVQLAGGTLTCVSQPGAGSTFTAIVPVACCQPPRVPPVAEAPLPLFATQTSVLVVEDHPVNQKMLSEQLRVLGCHSEVASDGESALTLLREENYYDVILLDCNLPDIDGYQVAEAIRHIEQERGSDPTPLIAISAMSGPEHRQRCEKSGMTAMLAKPIGVAALGEMLARWCVQLAPAEPRAVTLPTLPDNMLQQYLQRDIDDFFDAMEDKDLRCMIYYAHRLKGVAQMYHCCRLAQLAAGIEQHLRAAGVAAIPTQRAQWISELTVGVNSITHP